MNIIAASHYLPKRIIKNGYFKDKNGMTDDDIFAKSGIQERRWASDIENTNTMGIEAVKLLIPQLPFPIEEIDLIIGATYTPYDTVGTLAHAVQRHFGITNARAVTISSACSSFISSCEIAQGYFAMNKSKKALVICSEHNSKYLNISHRQSAHLWGDGAAAVVINNDTTSVNALYVIDLDTIGLGTIGKGPEGVWLRPLDGKLTMPFGRDVFMYACKYMAELSVEILTRNNLSTDDVAYLIPHQANMRIINNVLCQLKLSDDMVLVNIRRLGNTGAAGCVTTMSENWAKFKKDDIIVLSVFGGGYSAGTMVLRKS